MINIFYFKIHKYLYIKKYYFKLKNKDLKIIFRLHLFQCKMFSECKIFSGENIFGKGKYFQVFGCIIKIILENFSSVWLHYENAIFLLVSYIFSASKKIS